MTHVAAGSDATTILVVEDDADTREFYELLLATEGYHVLAAGSGKAALAQVAARQPDGIVLDRRLPDIDGIDLCRLLRERVDGSVPIIFISADREPGLESSARAAGITAFVAKPFSPAELLDPLRRLA